MVSAGSFTMIKVLFLLDSISLYYNKRTVLKAVNSL